MSSLFFKSFLLVVFAVFPDISVASQDALLARSKQDRPYEHRLAVLMMGFAQKQNSLYDGIGQLVDEPLLVNQEQSQTKRMEQARHEQGLTQIGFEEPKMQNSYEKEPHIDVSVEELIQLTTPSEQEMQQLFEEFVIRHRKHYKHEQEWRMHYNIFKKNADKVRRHNIAHRAGHHNYTMALNEHADLSWEEFRGNYLGFMHRKHSVWRSGNRAHFTEQQLHDLPIAVDWREKGAVTPVKNQGQCGSCWSFSATGAIEGANAIASGNLISLSEQELIDCSTADGNNGCDGGLMDYAFQFVIENGGLCAEDAYPYSATGPNMCEVKQCEAAVKISSFKDIPDGDEKSLLAALAQGPVSVAIEADQESFQFYSTGVFDGECGTNLDHGVLAVGYGTDEEGKDFYIVKNSWGDTWGEQGYIKLVRNSNQCGIASAASFPVV